MREHGSRGLAHTSRMNRPFPAVPWLLSSISVGQRWLVGADAGLVADGLDLQSKPELDPNTWTTSWASGEDWPGQAKEVVNRLHTPGIPCEEVKSLTAATASHGGVAAGLAAGAVLPLMQELGIRFEAGHDEVPYEVLFGEAAASLRVALEVVQLLSFVAMAHKQCFASAARSVLGQSLVQLQAALKQHVSTMWWMFDIGQFSNTNSPRRHFEAVHVLLERISLLFARLAQDLVKALDDTSFFWGHEEHGMFMNSTVMYRQLFPESAIVDKGILRFILRLLPQDSSLADFGALDGQYASWLNDTGWVTAFAFDGVQGIAELTGGTVSQTDLAGELVIPWRDEPFDWVLCLEVAEHIPPELEQRFLENLDRHAASGLILSWAPPHIVGEGHVNCLELEESRQRVEALGFAQDTVATQALREAAQVSWIAESVAVYRRLGGRRTSRA